MIASHPLHEAVDHALLARLVELDNELVAVNRGDVAVSELEMEYALADGEFGDNAGGFGDELALDGERNVRLAARAGCPMARRERRMRPVVVVDGAVLLETPALLA